MVENDLGNLNFRSKKLEKGKNSIAIKNAKKKGAKMLCPNLMRYPMPIMEMIAKESFSKKGSLKKFIRTNCGCIKLLKPAGFIKQ